VLPDLILAAIRKHQPSGNPPILLACSGGVDSQVLLHAAAQVWLAPAIFVAHVHHGLQPEADDWLAFCRATAGGLGLPFLSRRLPPLPDRIAGGVEAWARRLRYQALADMAQAAGARLVLTAHHADDQLETYRLRRLRGAGPLGLGAMRDSAPMPGAPDRLLLRPFLGLARQHILDHASAHGIEWVDDPSNQDLRHARNRVRKELAQQLLQDPEGPQRSLTEIGGFQGLADAARRQAGLDLAASRLVLAEPEGRWCEATGAFEPTAVTDSLSRASLGRLPVERAGEAIRLWLEEAGCRMPSRARLAEMIRQLCGEGSAHARLQHDGIWLLRYRDRIDAVGRLPPVMTPTWFRWSGEPLLDIGGQRYLFHRIVPGSEAWQPGLDAQRLAAAELMIDKARGGDRLRLVPGGRHRTWKNLSQERGIPPWMRMALPVLREGATVIHAGPFGMNLAIAENVEGVAVPASCPPDPAEERIAIEWLAPRQWARWL